MRVNNTSTCTLHLFIFIDSMQCNTIECNSLIESMVLVVSFAIAHLLTFKEESESNQKPIKSNGINRWTDTGIGIGISKGKMKTRVFIRHSDPSICGVFIHSILLYQFCRCNQILFAFS